MRTFALFCLLISTVWAQTSSPARPTAPVWRSSLSSLPDTPPANTSARDIVEFEKNMRMAAAYLGNTSPTADAAQWESNRALVRRMAAYLYGLQGISNNRQLRGPITRAQHSFDTLGFAPYLAYIDSAPAPYTEGPPTPVAVSVQMPPPFPVSAPELSGVNDADKQTGEELRTRYENDSARSAAVWQNAEILRQNLEARGMGLNLDTATSMIRMPQCFNSASRALRHNDWETARTQLERAEAETDKIAKTVGR